MVYLAQDTQNRPHDKSPIIYNFLPDIWVKLVGHISDRVLVAPMDMGGHSFGRYAAIWLFHCTI